MESKYETPVLPTDCSRLNLDDINNIFGKILYEFPIETLNITFPKWVDGLSNNHWLKVELYKEIKEAFINIKILKQVNNGVEKLQDTEIITKTVLDEIRLGDGSVNISINLLDELFYKILTEISGVNISNEGDLFSTITSLANTKKNMIKFHML